MAKQRELRFPKGFLWGTASSSHQCEGGNVNNQWYRWEQQGRILSGEECGQAANWWENAEQDFELAEQMENNALRLSLEWSRIEPREGVWDSSALERYREMLQDLRRRNMTPVVTLHHFTEPLWFTERGGFARGENVRYFLRYVNYVTRALKDLCDFWVTLNEPNVYAVQGYQMGEFPPGERDLLRALRVLHTLMRAHVEAFYAIRLHQPQARIGYCLHYRLLDPAFFLSPLDHAVAGVQDSYFNWNALKLAEEGRYAFPWNLLTPGIRRAAGARDYHGVNYYTRELVSFDPGATSNAFGRRSIRPGAVCNDEGLDGHFGEIYPEGMYRVLYEVYRRTRGNKPLYISENGFCDARDDRRPAAILEHLAQAHRAIQDGIPVKGYFYWSLVDNFEWNNGWHVRFGLIDLDPRTQRRTPRRSASMFGEICRANAITEEIVARYAPKALESIFGPHEELQHLHA
jgi:beta-glucosidase